MSLNCGHQLLIPHVIYEHEEPWWSDRGKLLICPPELYGNPISSHLVEKQEQQVKGMMNLALGSVYLFRLRRTF
jgi:hypothetical protein